MDNIIFNNFELKYPFVKHKSTRKEYSDGYYYQMRNWQKRNFDIIQDEKYFGIIAPTGSGKSLLISSISYDYLIKNTRNKVIIAVPQINIGSGYITTRFIDKAGSKILLSPEYAILNRDNTCSQFDDFINEKNVNVNSRICICSYNTLNSWYEKNGIDKLKNILLWIDENHHLRSATSKYDTEVITYNTLAKVVTDMLPVNRIGLSTATFFRGDGHSLLPPDILSKFKIVRHNYDEYFEDDCQYINSFKSYTILYTGEDHKDAVLDIINKDPKKPTVVYLPPVEAHNPHRKRDYINHLKENLQDIKIIDIADNRHEDDIHASYTIKQAKGIKEIDRNNRIAKEYHFAKSEVRDTLPKPDIDLIISQNLMKEGTDYLPLERVIIIGNRKAVGGNIQMIGRCLRDYVEKTGRDLEIYFVVQRFNPDLSEDQDKNREIINSNLNILWQNMILEEMFTPNLKYIKNRKKLDKIPSISIWEETFGDQFVEIRKDIQTKILNTLPTGEGVTLAQQWEYFEQIVKSNLPEGIESEVVDRLVKSLKLRQQISGYKYRHPGIEIDMDLISDISPLDCIETYIQLSFDVDNIKTYRNKFISPNPWIYWWNRFIIFEESINWIRKPSTKYTNEETQLHNWINRICLNNRMNNSKPFPTHLRDLIESYKDKNIMITKWFGLEKWDKNRITWEKFKVWFIDNNYKKPTNNKLDKIESKWNKYIIQKRYHKLHPETADHKYPDWMDDEILKLKPFCNSIDIWFGIRDTAYERFLECIKYLENRQWLKPSVNSKNKIDVYWAKYLDYYRQVFLKNRNNGKLPIWFDDIISKYPILLNLIMQVKYNKIHKGVIELISCFDFILYNKRMINSKNESSYYDLIRTKKYAKYNKRIEITYSILYDDLADIYGLSGIFDPGFKLDVTKLRKPSQEEIDLILNKCIEEEKV